MVYQISYDFVGNWTDPAYYTRLDNGIKAYGTWMHVQRSEWFIETDQSPAQIHANLWQFMRPYDRLFIVRVQNEWCGTGLSDEQVQWLRQRTYTSLTETILSAFLPKGPLPVPSLSPALKGLFGSK